MLCLSPELIGQSGYRGKDVGIPVDQGYFFLISRYPGLLSLPRPVNPLGFFGDFLMTWIALVLNKNQAACSKTFGVQFMGGRINAKIRLTNQPNN